MREELLKEYLVECGWDCIRIIRYYKPYVEFGVSFRGSNVEVKHIIKIDYEKFGDWCEVKREDKIKQLL